MTIAATVTRAEVEDFLFHEAQLLDEWRLDEWLGLFEPGARFEVPTTDAGDLDMASAGYFVADDWGLIQARVKRLKSRKAHAENPRSRTVRFITNVRVVPSDEPETVRVGANYLIHRFRDGHAFTYVGRYQHLLVVGVDGLRFRLRRAVPVEEALEPGARLSFIL